MLNSAPMHPLRARVEDGQIIVEDKAELPNGEIYVLAVSADEVQEAKRERELELSLKDEEAGRFVAFQDVLASLGPQK